MTKKQAKGNNSNKEPAVQETKKYPENSPEVKVTPEKLKEFDEDWERLQENKENENKEAAKEFENIIASEKELLEKFDPNRLKKVSFIYGRDRYDFSIRPIRGAEDINAVSGIDLSAYADIDEMEKEIVIKKNKGEELTKDEQKTYDTVNKRLRSEVTGNALKQVHDILVRFVSPPEYLDITDLKERYNAKIYFWENFVFDLKMLLFSEVTERLGISPTVTCKLFQANRID